MLVRLRLDMAYRVLNGSYANVVEPTVVLATSSSALNPGFGFHNTKDGTLCLLGVSRTTLFVLFGPTIPD
jgi:hypothetical protein